MKYGIALALASMLSWPACWQLGRPGHRPVVVRLFTPGVGLFESASIVDGNEGSVSGTAQFPIGAGQMIAYRLACEKSGAAVSNQPTPRVVEMMLSGRMSPVWKGAQRTFPPGSRLLT